MSQRFGLVERANEIAREGRCTSIADMQTILMNEGYEGMPEKLSDATLNHQLELNVEAGQRLIAAGDRLHDMIAKAPEAQSIRGQCTINVAALNESLSQRHIEFAELLLGSLYDVVDQRAATVTLHVSAGPGSRSMQRPSISEGSTLSPISAARVGMMSTVSTDNGSSCGVAPG